MRILVDCRHLNQHKQSGVGEYTVSILQALFLLSNSHEYILFTSGRTKPNLESIIGNHPFVKQVHIPTANKFLNIKTLLFKHSTIDQYIQNTIDLIFLPNLNIISLPTNIPTILTVHDLSWYHFPEFYSLKMRLWHKLLNPKYLIKKCHTLITPSNATKQDLLNTYSVQSSLINIIPHGISSAFHPEMESRDHGIRSRLKLPKRFALFVGTLEPRKNILSVIEAIKQYRELSRDDLHLVLVGSWGWNTNELRRRLWRKDVHSWVHKLGYIKSEDIPAIYRSATIFVWPSFYEGFGLPVLEALACGTPVITSHVSSMPEIAENSAIYIDPFNIQDITNAIKSVVQSKPLLDQLRKNGLEQAKKFTWEKTAKETIKLFEINQ